MNILLVIADLGLGGAQQVVINLANELTRQDHNVWIYDVYPQLRREGMVRKLNDKVNLIDPDYGKLNLLEKGINSFLYRTGMNTNYQKERLEKKHQVELQQVLKANTIDAVNSHVFWADQFVLNELTELHDRWWVTLHASYSNLLRSGRKEHSSTMIRIFQQAKGIIYIAEDEKNSVEELIGKSEFKLRKVYNGIPYNQARHDDESEQGFKLLCASRAIKEKGWEELILAIKQLNGSNELILAGDGPDLEHFKQVANADPNIKFLGFHQNIPSLINQVNVVVLPSYTEMLPTILLESIFSYKPVISTNVGEVDSIINNENGACGIVINASRGQELINDLKNSIDLLKSNYNNYVSKEPYEKAQDIFSVETMAKNYIRLFCND